MDGGSAWAAKDRAVTVFQRITALNLARACNGAALASALIADRSAAAPILCADLLLTPL
jgi:hypothetical protein